MPDATPRATYRVQLHAGFTFDAAAAIVPYLARLGISHLYVSPILESAPGSMHGYDVVDPTRLSGERGGAEGFARLRSALVAFGMGLIVDIVPNHMAADPRANPWWWDVLENGPASRYASAFDIDWDPPEAKLRQVVLAPILADHYGRELEGGRIAIERDEGSFAVRYFEHEMPVSPRTLDDLLAVAAAECGSAELADIAEGCRSLPPASATDRESVRRRHRDKELLGVRIARLCDGDVLVAKAIDDVVARINASPDALDELLARQNYRLAWWRVAGQELDYRRFFDVPSLVALRMEDESVFADTHTLLLDLVWDGAINGLRVDHPDGLHDPRGYLGRLAEGSEGVWTVVEKILEPGEELPAGWPVAGTTGYDWLHAAGGVFVDPAGEAPLVALWCSITGEAADFAEQAWRAKHEVMARDLAADVERLTELLVQVCERQRRHRDHTRVALREALREIVAAFPVYRTYLQPGTPASAGDVARIEEAVAAAGRRRSDIDAELLAFAADILCLRVDGAVEAELAMRFQQTTGPVMAKGVEDTALYRDLRLASRCEVGGAPDRFATSVAEFHAHNAAAAERWPATMLTTSTHDTKRSADVRVRIGLLSEIPEVWAEAVARWQGANDRHRRGPWPDPATEYLLYQTLVGAWPIDTARVLAYLEKATREAKVHTSWADPDAAYEAAVADFATDVLADEAFVTDLAEFVAPLTDAGWVVALALTLLELTSPGVPDIYQGCELWDNSLVDPDNRRAVDFGRRAELLAELPEAAGEAESGAPKLFVIRESLAVRAERPDAFAPGAAYHPLPSGEHAVAYLRGDDVAVVVPRLVLGLNDPENESVALPPGQWVDRFTGTAHGGGPVPLVRLLARFPVALLVREG
ncbi:MAG: 1,4-alpha-D-glucan 1-alpha-D-glucosylmutase [Acidimicrobiales bacterium]|nr:1,4-alpha-D-glucan 1-alpha-D-glucosylmutase [Acidimicrobiales bacterium]